MSATPGTTRDRREGVGRIGDTTFWLVDTAGVDGDRIHHLTKSKSELVRKMMEQTLEAVKSADLILLMFDARVGPSMDFKEIARWIRRSSGDDASTLREVLVLANKLEGDRWVHEGSAVMDHLSEVERVGFGEAVPLSAEHGEGIADVAVKIEELKARIREENGVYEEMEPASTEPTEPSERPLQMAVVGRQNVGKSSLVNALLRQERVISGSMPGLTRDAISIEWTWNGRPVQLVDTAGIRKSAQRDTSDNIEDSAVKDAMRALKIADVAVLVLDAEAGIVQRQELAIADAVFREGRSLIVAANKMDLLVDAEYTAQDFAEAVRTQIEARIPKLRRTPVVAMSALHGDDVDKLMPAVFNSRDRWARVVSTGNLNRWLAEVTRGHPPPLHRGRPTKIKYIMQTKGRPPTFLLFCNVDELPLSYLRFLTRNFQDTFAFFGMEIRLAVKKSAENPYSKPKKRGGSGLGGHDARKKRTIKNLKSFGKARIQRRKKRRS